MIIRNLVVEKFMTPIQVTAIDNNGATGWQLIDCDVRWNHGAGSKIGDGGRTAGTRIREQGQLGVAGGGTALIFERNEVATNNTIGIDRGFEAGGTKFVFSTDAQIQENWVHHNNGNGLWLDISNTNPVVQRNLAEDNNWIGIFQEIGFGGRIIWNTSRRNGLDYTTFAPLGGGIVVTDSAGVEIAHNTLVDNRGGGVWALRDSRAGGVEGYELRDLWVHDNDITMHSGLGGGSDQPGNGIQDFTTGVAYTQNNRFNGNRYVVTSLSTTFWYWEGGPKTWAQWQALPQDTSGTATVG